MRATPVPGPGLGPDPRYHGTGFSRCQTGEKLGTWMRPVPFPGMYGRAMVVEDRGASTACLLQRAKRVERAVGEEFGGNV